MILGVILANVVIMALYMVSSLIYPLPPDFNRSDPAAMAEMMARMPPMAFLWVALAHFLGTAAGAALAARMARRAPAVQAVIVGCVLLALGVANLLMLPHPAWFWPVDLATYPLGAFVGLLLARRRPAAV